MIITPQALRGIYTAFNTVFNKAFEGQHPTYEKVATVVPSTSESETYAWLGDIPGMREWIGEREIQNLSGSAYTIKNKDFELTVGVDRNAVEDDKIGLYNPSIQMLGESAALLFTAGFAHTMNKFFLGLASPGATLTVALYAYAKEEGEFDVAFAIAARERLGGVFDGGDDAVVFRVFGEVDRRSDAEGQHPQERVENNIERIEYIRQYADRVVEIAHRCGQKLPRYIRHALYEDVRYKKQHESRGEKGAKPGQAAHRYLICPAPCFYVFVIHSTYPSSKGS